jgi:hypothetical protein
MKTREIGKNRKPGRMARKDPGARPDGTAKGRENNGTKGDGRTMERKGTGEQWNVRGREMGRISPGGTAAGLPPAPAPEIPLPVSRRGPGFSPKNRPGGPTDVRPVPETGGFRGKSAFFGGKFPRKERKYPLSRFYAIISKTWRSNLENNRVRPENPFRLANSSSDRHREGKRARQSDFL